MKEPEMCLRPHGHMYIELMERRRRPDRAGGTSIWEGEVKRTGRPRISSSLDPAFIITAPKLNA